MTFFLKNRRRLIRSLILLNCLLSTLTYYLSYDGSIFFYTTAFLSFFSVLYEVKMYKFNLSHYEKIVINFIFVMLICLLINYKISSIYSFINLINLFIMTYIVGIFKSDEKNIKKQLISYSKIVVFFTFFISLCSLVLLILKVDMVIHHIVIRMLYYNNRYFSIYFNPNATAIYSYISMMLSLILLLTKNTKSNYFHYGNIFLQIITIILTECRSVYISLLVTLIFLFLGFKKEIKISNKIISFIIFCFIGLSILVISFIVFRNDLNNGEKLIEILNVLSSGRLSLWIEGIQIFKHYPVFGVGISNINSAARLVLSNNSQIIINYYEQMHNIFMDLLLYGGLIGCFSFLYIFILIIKKIVHIIASRQLWVYAFVALLLGLFIFSLLDIAILFDTRLPAFVFWMGVALLLRLKDYKERSEDSL